MFICGKGIALHVGLCLSHHFGLPVSFLYPASAHLGSRCKVSHSVGIHEASAWALAQLGVSRPRHHFPGMGGPAWGACFVAPSPFLPSLQVVLGLEELMGVARTIVGGLRKATADPALRSVTACTCMSQTSTTSWHPREIMPCCCLPGRAGMMPWASR